MCTAGEEKLAGEPGGRKGWSRRQAERAAEKPPAKQSTRNCEEIKRMRKRQMGGSDRGDISSRCVRREGIKKQMWVRTDRNIC